MNRSVLRLAFVLALLGIATLAGAAAAAPASSEQAGLGFQGLGVRLGVVDPEDASSTVAFGAHVDAGQFVPHLHFIPNFEYWSVGAGGFDSRDLSIATDVNLDFPLQNSMLVPYIGGGLGLHFFSFDAPAGVIAPDSETKLGFNLGGGIRDQFMPNLSGFAEVRYSFVEDFNQLKLMGGFTYHFIY